MAVSCAVHHSAQRLSFDGAVQTVNFSNMSDDESDVFENVTPAPVVEHLAPGPAERCTSTRDRVCGVCTHEFVSSPASVITLLEPPVPVVHVVQVPQVQIIEKTVEFPVVQSAQSTRTPENLATVPVREMMPAANLMLLSCPSFHPPKRETLKSCFFQRTATALPGPEATGLPLPLNVRHQKKNLPLALMVSHKVFTDVLVDWVPTSCSTYMDLLWKVALSQPFSLPNHQLSMTMVLL